MLPEQDDTDAEWQQFIQYYNATAPLREKKTQHQPDPLNYQRYHMRFDRSRVTVSQDRWADYLPYFIASLGTRNIDGWASHRLEEMRRDLSETTGGGDGHCTQWLFTEIVPCVDIGDLKYVECSVFLKQEKKDNAIQYQLAYMKTTHEYSGKKAG